MHVPFVWWLVLHVCVLTVAASHQPPAWERITIQTASIHPSACHRKLFLWAGAEATGYYFWALSPVFFSKGRSRVWLMSRLSWTGWLASKTPWFQLTIYHRRQRTKREGNKNSCIVQLILWKNICTCEHKKTKQKKIDQIPNACISQHTVVSLNEIQRLSEGWRGSGDEKRKRT